MSAVLVIIPALNEEATIGQVVGNLLERPGISQVVVIDDGSDDRTQEVAQAEGAAVVRLGLNLGIGGAMQTGYRFACDGGFDVAVQVDGDGQHDASQLEAILQPILVGEADMVTGSRFLEPGYRGSWTRAIGIRFFASLVSLIIGQRVTDTTSGFRAANRAVIELFADDYPQDYPEVETTVLVHRAGFRIREVPVKMHARQGGESSITPIRAVYYMIKVTLALLIGLLRRPAARRVDSPV